MTWVLYHYEDLNIDNRGAESNKFIHYSFVCFTLNEVKGIKFFKQENIFSHKEFFSTIK